MTWLFVVHSRAHLYLIYVESNVGIYNIDDMLI